MTDSTTQTAAQLRVRFDPRHLVALAPFIAQHDIRYYLCGLRVEPAPVGVYLVATNGHMLAVVHDASGSMTGGSGTVLRITAQCVAAARQAARQSTGKAAGKLRPCVLVRGTRLLIAPDFDHEGGEQESFVQPGPCVLEGLEEGTPADGRRPLRYPDWRKVLPDFAGLKRGALNGDSSMVNAAYLAVWDKLAPRDRKGVTLWHHPNKPGMCVVQLDGRPEMVGAIMEMRGMPSDDARKALPLIDRPAAAPALAGAGQVAAATADVVPA